MLLEVVWAGLEGGGMTFEPDLAGPGIEARLGEKGPFLEAAALSERALGGAQARNLGMGPALLFLLRPDPPLRKAPPLWPW